MNTFAFLFKKALQTGTFFLALALLFACLLVVPSGFPYLGLALSLGILSISVFLSKNTSSRFLKILFGFSLVFCACLVYRSHEFLTFLNLISVIVLGSLMSLLPTENPDQAHEGFLDVVLAPIKTLINAIKTKAEYSFSLKETRQALKKTDTTHWISILKSLAVSLALVIVIVPLLASTNPIFARWAEQTYNWINIDEFLKIFQIENVALWTYRVMATALFFFLIPRLITFAQTGQLEQKVRKGHSFALLLPKIVVAIVLGIFFLSQTQLYFASSEALSQLGYSHSEFAREVFAQLTIVALIIIGLIYNDKNTKKISRILTYILFLEALFLTGIALKSVYDYSAQWGLTYKRLWGVAGVAWMFGALGSFISLYRKRLPDSHFVKSIIILSCGVLLAINIVNFDYLIFHYSKSSTGEGIDYRYLSSLSSDSLSYKEQFETFSNLSQTESSQSATSMNAYAARTVSSNISVLQKKYATVRFQTFNLAEYKQYREIKDLELTSYDDKWRWRSDNTLQNSNTTQPLKHVNRFDRFPMRTDLTTISPLITYYSVNTPAELTVEITPTEIIDDHQMSNDIWGQAGINFSAVTEPLTLSQESATELLAGRTPNLPSQAPRRFVSLRIFVVKTLANNSTGTVTTDMNTHERFVVISENAFKKDGRALAQLIGYALGLQQPQAQHDQSLVTGLMGNQGFFDISAADTLIARESALRLQQEAQRSVR